MNELLNIFKALSDKNRLRIILALMQKEELCACQITELLRVSGATASRHLSILSNASLIKSRKSGRWIYFKLNTENEDLLIMHDWIKNSIDNSVEFQSNTIALQNIVSCDPEILRIKQNSNS